jgi:hypothetical protein
MTADVCREPAPSISDHRVPIVRVLGCSSCLPWSLGPSSTELRSFNFHREHGLEIFFTFPNLLLILPVTTPVRSGKGETAVVTVLLLNVEEHNVNVTKRQLDIA